MARRSGLSCLLLAFLLNGCVQTSSLYAVRQWPTHDVGDPDDVPRVDYAEQEAKPSFVQFVDTACGAKEVADSDNMNEHGFTPGSWADNNRIAAGCVQRIAAYATDQCVLISRRQNVVASDANLALGAVTMGSGLTAVAYAIKGGSDDRLTAASLAGAAGASNTSRSFLPTNSNVLLTNFLTNAMLYAEDIGLADEDVALARTYKSAEAHDLKVSNLKANRPANGTQATTNASDDDAAISGDVEMIKLARVHDAVFAACGANAYGPMPAARAFTGPSRRR